MGAAPLARSTRRALLAGFAGSGVGCALPWQRTDPRAPLYTPPPQTPVSYGPPRLRLVLARETSPALDRAITDALTQAGNANGYKLDLLDISRFASDAGTSDVLRQLLIAVQAGLPPDGLLLLGRGAPTPRLRGMGLIQEVSGLVRRARARLGTLPEAVERAHYYEGNWLAAPLYQRLIGHFVRQEALQRAGLTPEAATSSWNALSHAVTAAEGWGIGPADTADADAWCWSAIHAWGGALVDRDQSRIALASPETAAAVGWLSAQLRGRSWPDVPDAQKDALFARGDSAYTYSEGSSPLSAGGVLVAGPAGPAFRPRAVGGGAVWVLPRGAQADATERLWETLWQPELQRALWRAGGGFALPPFEGQWVDWGPTAAGSLPASVQESVQRFRALLSFGGFISDSGQAGKPTPASQAVETSRLATRLVRAVAQGRLIEDALAAAQRDAEAIYREHAFPTE